MAHIYRFISILAVFIIANVYCEDASDECIPKPPEHGKERPKCCKVPDLMKKHEDGEMHKAMHNCFQSMKESNPDLLPEGLHGPHPHPPKGEHKPHGPPPVKFLECIQECIFNTSGLMTADMKPNVEALTKMADEFIGAEESWKPVAYEAIKKCSESKPEVKEDAVCKSGAHQTSICMMREMYLNCPQGSWTDNDECKAEKALIEKCPELPPPLHHMKHHKDHHKDQ